MKAISLLFMVTTMMSGETKISDFQWQSRLLVIPGGDAAWIKKLEIEEAHLKERDVRVFILGFEEGSKYAPKPELAKQFADRFQPNPKKPRVYLMGKDSQTTLEWSMIDFSFDKLYASIDAMPMRQREISDRQ
jgi:hypothetical protein